MTPADIKHLRELCKADIAPPYPIAEVGASDVIIPLLDEIVLPRAVADAARDFMNGPQGGELWFAHRDQLRITIEDWAALDAAEKERKD